MTVKTEIVIPTLADAPRAPMLMRAIDSVTSQGARALVVVNGSRFEPGLLSVIAANNAARLLRLDPPSLPNAIYEGRRAVDAHYFGFLDDDDYLLPHTLSTREARLDAQAEVQAVVANGRREEWGDDQSLFKNADQVAAIAADPLGHLLRANWLTPCGGLYRTASVPADTFVGLAKYVEWTEVAFRLCAFARIEFLLEHTFVQSDTAGSLSKHAGQAVHALALHDRIRPCLREPRHIKPWNDRVRRLHHDAANEALMSGQRLLALRHHLKSMLHAPGIYGLRYALFTRKILAYNWFRGGP